MKVVRIKNQDLDEPYCYEYWDEELDTWVGISIYDPTKEIEDYILFDEKGWVYAETPYGMNGTPIDRIAKWEWKEKILPMVGDPMYPSAELIET